ncbi:MAG: hypothetical protein E7112_02405 [Bacteroidales bacterium]|nr:hypothetical protein [Bacteroidales bacterium]
MATLVKKILIALMLLGLGTFFSSCEKIFEYEGDCSIHCQIRFRYDMNMKFADAFANSVSHVTVYVYDAGTGKLVLKQTESGPALSDRNYVMELEGLQPGTYDIVVWGGDGLEEGTFTASEVTAGVSEVTEIQCMMERDNVDGKAQVTEDVRQLYHGIRRVTFDDTYGTQVEEISLVKNTNVVRIVLQHLYVEDVDPDNFIFEIQDDNGYMDYDNDLLEDDMIHYYPWSVTAGQAGIEADIYTKTITNVNAAVAELTIGRLMEGGNTILNIYNREKGEKVLSIPLVDYALLVKGNYNKGMSDQEYLDRQDEYNLTFFLDGAGRWISSEIYINSWRVVLQEDSVLQ